ncbi:MAG: ABC transporter permease [Firmicutes bacterium]|nr:ABC transporter permease [Bacillota bacterium]
MWRRFGQHRAAVAGAAFLLVLAASALTAPLWLADEAGTSNLANNLAAPSRAHPLGTDELGRDLLGRIVSGARVSLVLGLISVSLAAVAGVPLGLAAGYYQRTVDRVIMRAIDVLLAFPSILLAIFVVTVLGPGLQNAMIAIGIAQVPVYVRLVRGQTLALRRRDFVEASRAVGATDARILARHVLPNTIGPLIVQTSLLFGTAILAAAYLGFLGLGVQPPVAEWGTMLSKARLYLRTAPHVVVLPGGAIFLTVLAFNLVGDGLRDALDPRVSQSRAARG